MNAGGEGIIKSIVFMQMLSFTGMYPAFPAKENSSCKSAAVVRLTSALPVNTPDVLAILVCMPLSSFLFMTFIKTVLLSFE